VRQAEDLGGQELSYAEVSVWKKRFVRCSDISIA
jgi:hypothetical protein